MGALRRTSTGGVQSWVRGLRRFASSPAPTETSSSRRRPPRLSLLNSGSGTITYSWTNGRTSTFSYNYTAVVASGAVVVTNTGTVTAGAFLGQSGTETFTLATNPTRCLAAGGLPGAGGATALVLA